MKSVTMSKMVSFSLSNQQHKTDNNVNNTTNIWIDKPDVPVEYKKSPSPSCKERSVYSEREQTEECDADSDVVVIKTLTNKQEELYMMIIKAFSDILRKNDKALIGNLIDFTGKIIVGAEVLIELIAIVCDAQKDQVIINFLEEDVGCFQKISSIKNISSIKVNNLDMYIKFNDAYNTLSNKYFISLEKVIVPMM